MAAAIALIAERRVNTLIIVDRVSLLEQWCERLSVFLNVPKKDIGIIGGGKKKPTGIIDVAVSQSLYRDNKVSELVKGYGQIICDECHHVSAVGFEQIMKNSPAKYKYGLTATLKRKDGKERIVLMQLGPVRYKDLSKVTSELEHKVLVQETGMTSGDLQQEHTTNELYDYLYINLVRNMQIVMDVRNCLDEKRYPIVLTERKEHIDLLEKELSFYVKVYKLHGGLKKKEREGIMAELQNLPEDEPRVIIATSKYVGEGFDYPILDTLFLTLPIEDDRVADDELVLSIGRASEFGLKGLSGLESNELYRDVVIGDLLYSADELLEYALPKLLQQNSGKLPVNKYLRNATKEFPEYQKLVKDQDFNSLISNTIKNNRKALGAYISVRQIWENESNNLEKATRLIAYLSEEQIDIVELENLLVALFEEDVNVLQNASQSERTNIKRLIRIYDYLKWGK